MIRERFQPEMSKDTLISIVDDDALARDGIRELVESLGYNAVTFMSAENFLESGMIAETTCASVAASAIKAASSKAVPTGRRDSCPGMSLRTKAGTRTVAWHCGHRARLPENSSLTLSFLPQAGHWKEIIDGLY